MINKVYFPLSKSIKNNNFDFILLLSTEIVGYSLKKLQSVQINIVERKIELRRINHLHNLYLLLDIFAFLQTTLFNPKSK